MQRWYVKTPQNQTLGPMTEEEVVEKLTSGYFVGQELVCKANDARWIPITQHPAFFEAVVDEMDQELKKEMAPPVKEEATDVGDGEKEKREVPLWKRLQIKVPNVEEKEIEQPVGQSVGQSTAKPWEPEKPRVPLAQPPQREQTKKSLLFFVAVIGAMLLFLFFYEAPKDSRKDRIRLSPVRFNSKIEIRQGNDEMLKSAISTFRKHTIADYVQTQTTLTTLLEKNVKYLDAMGFLCMTYKELWPYAYQDSKDIDTIYRVYRQASVLKASSASAGVCYVVYLLTVAEYEKAKNYMEDALRREPDLLFFNQLMGDLLEQQRKHSTAAYYFQKVADQWPPPVWAKPLLQLARTLRKLKRYAESLENYRKALQFFPEHPWVQLELGVLEFEAFRQNEKAQTLITKALSKKTQFPAEMRGEGYFVLAQIALQTGYKKKALEYANQAFSVDSGNQAIKDFILNLGGRGALENVQIDSGNMLYLGTQYMKLGNYFAAQAEFRLAFEADPRNALAAYHAGQSLWELNQSTEAIKWVEKAIQADPGLISAYATLADYYAFRHNYEGAAQILKNISRRFPNNNEIYRGFANIEYKRGNLKMAIDYARKALDAYPMDVGALQIISRAYVDLADFKSAYNYVWRSLEVDPHTPENHAIYSKVLVGTNGLNAAIDYLNQKIEEAPDVIVYKKALAEIFIESKNWNGARTLLENILVVKKEDKATSMSLAYVYQQEGYINRALETYLMAASFDPLDPTPLFQAGELYMEAGSYKSAIAQFERVLKINKNFPRVYSQLGRAALENKDYTKAIEMAKMEKELNPSLAEPYILTAEAYYRQDQYQECAGEYQKAIMRRSQGTDIYIQMARCYRLSGALDPAIQMLDKAAQIESGNANIYKELGAIYHMQGQRQQAYSAYERYLHLAPNASDRGAIEKVMKELH